MSLRERIRLLSQDNDIIILNDKLTKLCKNITYELRKESFDAFKRVFDIEIGDYGCNAENLSAELRENIERTILCFKHYDVHTLNDNLDNPGKIGKFLYDSNPNELIITAPYDQNPNSNGEVEVTVYAGDKKYCAIIRIDAIKLH